MTGVPLRESVIEIEDPYSSADSSEFSDFSMLLFGSTSFEMLAYSDFLTV